MLTAAFVSLRAQCPGGWATFYIVGPSAQNPTGAVFIVEENPAQTFVSLNGGPAITFSDGYWLEGLASGTTHTVSVTDVDGCAEDTTFFLGAAATGCNELFISEYIEGSSNNKAIEIYNPTPSPIDLSLYKICTYYNAGPSGGVFQLSGTIAPYGTHVVAHAQATQAILNLAQQTQAGGTGTALQFNGNDAVALYKYPGGDSVLVDMFGVKFQNPTGGWTDAGGTVVTADRTLVRKPSVTQGRTANLNTFVPTDEWDVLPIDTYSNLGMHSSACSSGGGTDCNLATAPTLNVSGGCVGQPLSMVAESSLAYDYLIIVGPNGQVYPEEIDFPSATAQMSGTYRAFALVNGCATPAASVDVFVSNPVNLSVGIQGSTTVCAGTALALTAQVTGGEGNVVWTAPGGQTYFGLEINVVNPASGTWTVAATPSCGTAGTQTFEVNVVNIPAPVAESNSPVEVGGTIELSAIYEPPGMVFWTGPNGFTAQGPGVQIPNASVFDSGVYSAYVVASGCTSAVSSVTVVVGTGDCNFDVAVEEIPASPGQPGAVVVTRNGGAALPYVYTLTASGQTITDTVNHSPFVVLVPGSGVYSLHLDAGCNDTVVGVSIAYLDPNGCQDLFISEYLEGFSNNKAVEIYNPTPEIINLSAYKLWGVFNQGGANQRKSAQLEGTIEPLGTHVVVRHFAWNDILNLADQLDSFAVNFNGNDAVLLVKYNSPTDSVILDVFGVPGQNPVDGWAGPDGVVVTKDQTLRRKSFVQSGRRNASAPFNPLLEWEVFPVNTYSGLGQHTSSCGVGGGCTGLGTPTALAGPACVGQDLTLRAVTPSGTDYVLWYGPNGFAAVSDSNAVVFNVTTQNSGTYTVVAYGNGCVSAPATVNVSIGQNVNVSVNGTAVSSQVCEGGTVSLNATGTPGAVFSWTGPNAFSSSIAGPTIPNATPAQSGEYIVAARPANGCGPTAYDTVTITITPRPSSPVPQNAQITLSSGETLTLSADAPAGAMLLWSGPAGFSAEGSTVTRGNVTGDHAGTYSVVAVVQGCSSVVATVEVQVLTSRALFAGLEHKIYPNPSFDGRFVLSLAKPAQKLAATVYDATGKMVWENNGAGAEMDIVLDVPGVYVLKFQTEYGTAAAVLIRQ